MNITPEHLDSNEYYTPQALAEKWGCAKNTVYDLLRTGKLQGFKLGRDWRISDEARLAYEHDLSNQQPKIYRNSRGQRTPILRVV